MRLFVNQTLAKRIWYSFLVIAAIVFSACQQELEGSKTTIEKVHSIGENIDRDIAESWINNFQLQNPEALQAYLFGKDILTDLMSKEGVAGIWIMKGLTELNEERLVLYPANEEGIVWTQESIKGRTSDETTTVDNGQKCPPHCPESGVSSRLSKRINEIGSEIEQNQGIDWTNRYEELNPNKVRGFLFGDEILTKLINTKGSEGIWFYLGLNEENEERLVLYSADKGGRILNAKVSTATEANSDGIIGEDPVDDGQGCPPYCP